MFDRPVALRLHGIPERSQGAGDRAQARLAIRYHVDVVFRITAGAETFGAVWNAFMAGPSVHRDESVGQRRHRLFSDSDWAGG